MYSTKFKTLLTAISLTLLLVACAGNQAKPIPVAPDVVTVVKFTATECPSKPSLAPVQFLPVYWATTMDEDEDVLFTLTPKQYESLSKNMADVLGALEGKNSVIRYYEECLAQAKEIADREN